MVRQSLFQEGEVTPIKEVYAEKIRWILSLTGFVLLLAGLYIVCKPFLAVIAWSVIFVLTTWPIYTRLLAASGHKSGLCAFLMTSLLAVVVISLVTPVVTSISHELEDAGTGVRDFLESPRAEEIRLQIEKFPVIGKQAAVLLRQIERGRLEDSLGEHPSEVLGVVTLAAQRVVEIIIKLFVFLFITFFMYRDGTSIGRQVRTALYNIGGERFDRLFNAAKDTLKATVYGTILTAFVQGALAGLGYWAAGAPVPLLFGLATTIMAFMPFGTPLVYVPITLMLLVNGAPLVNVIGLLLWGVLVVSMIDNVLRPIFIGQRTNMSVIFVFVGVIGGTLAFGFIGIFIGPVIIALTKVVWDEWVGHSVIQHIQPAA